MAEILLDETLGYVDVTVGETTVTLDAFETNDRLADLNKEHQGKPHTEYAAAVQDLIVSLGLPRVSVYTAGQFVRRIVAVCEEVKKKADPSPELPASTAAIHSN